MNSEPSPDGESSRQWECHSPLFEGTTDPIAHVKLDAERSILDVNASFEKVFGCDRAGVSGRSLLDVAAPETETDEQVEAIPTTRDGDPIRREVRRATADGSRVFLYQFIPGQEQETDGGRLKDGYAVYTDLTDRANRELERVDSEQYRKRLYTITSDTGLSDEKKITQLLELGCERLGVENGHLVTIDRHRSRHEIVNAFGSDLVQAGTITDLSETYCRETVTEDELLAVYNAVEQGYEGDPAYERWNICRVE